MSERKTRKPLIEPGSVLGSQPDIMSSVLNSYADKTGQPAPFAAEPPTATREPVEDSTRVEAEETEAPAHPEVVPPSKPASKPSSQLADKPARQQKSPRGKAKDVDAEEEARIRAESPKRLCSYRIPEGLDDWLEEQAFEHRHSGLKKQDLVAQAIQLLIVAKAASEEQRKEDEG